MRFLKNILILDNNLFKVFSENGGTEVFTNLIL